MTGRPAQILIGLWAAVLVIAGGIAAVTYDDDGTSAADQRVAETIVLKLTDLPQGQGWAVSAGTEDDDSDSSSADLSEDCQQFKAAFSDAGDRFRDATSDVDSPRFERQMAPSAEQPSPGVVQLWANAALFRDGGEAAGLALMQDPRFPTCVSEYLRSDSRVQFAEPTIESRPVPSGDPGVAFRIATAIVAPPVPVVFDTYVAFRGRVAVSLFVTAANTPQLSDPEIAALLQAMLARIPVDPAPTTAPTTTN